MTAYSDIPAANALYQEQQQVQAAIDYLNNEGAIVWMSISPPPPVAGISPMNQMTVSIALSPPNPAALVDQALVALQARADAINQELLALDVTDPPVTPPSHFR